MLLDFMQEKSYRALCRSFVDSFSPTPFDTAHVANAYIHNSTLFVYEDHFWTKADPVHHGLSLQHGRWTEIAVDRADLDESGYGPTIYPTGLSPVQVDRRRLGLDHTVLFPKGARVHFCDDLPWAEDRNGDEIVGYGDIGIVLEACDDPNVEVKVDFGGHYIGEISASLLLNEAEWHIFELGWQPWQIPDETHATRWRLELPDSGRLAVVA